MRALPDPKHLLSTLVFCFLIAVPVLLSWALPGREGADPFGQQVLLMATVYLAFGAGALLMHKRRPGLLALLCGLLLLARAPIEHDAPASPDSVLHIAHFELQELTDDGSALLEKVRATKADLLTISAANEAFLHQMVQDMCGSYPHSEVRRSGDSATAVFSRHPLGEVRSAGHGDVQGKWMHPLGELHFYVAADSGEAVEEKLSRAHAFAQQVNGPCIISGALQAEPLGSKMVRFRQASGMRDSRHSLLQQHPSLFGAPSDSIDYIFYSPELSCLEFESVFNTGLQGARGRYRLPSES